jgi:membrane protein involved in colicin uptake
VAPVISPEPELELDDDFSFHAAVAGSSRAQELFQKPGSKKRALKQALSEAVARKAALDGDAARHRDAQELDAERQRIALETALQRAAGERVLDDADRLKAALKMRARKQKSAAAATRKREYTAASIRRTKEEAKQTRIANRNTDRYDRFLGVSGGKPKPTRGGRGGARGAAGFGGRRRAVG